MESFLRYFQVRAFGRGMRGYNTAWFVVAAAAWMVIRARRTGDIAYSTRLRPGERLVISTSPSGSSSSSNS